MVHILFISNNKDRHVADTPLKKTPLYDSHPQLGARMVNFGGWEMPVQYDGIIAEHERTRADVSLFDICHMGEFLVTGPDALSALDRVLTADISTLSDGQCRYGFLLNESGGVIDDLITYRFSADRWMLVVNAATTAGDFEWIKTHLKGDVVLQDISNDTGKIDIQGPQSREQAETELGTDLSDLKFFRFKTVPYRNREIIVSQTGYTGEHGYELFTPADMITALWSAFLDSGIKPAGLGARDTLRLEAGLPLYGHEFDQTRTPVEARFARFAQKTRYFIGKEALDEQRKNKPPQTLAAFRLAGRRAARQGHRVLCGDREVGTVTSGSYSPTLGCSIGMAYIARECYRTGEKITIDMGRTRLTAEIVALPFYKKA